MDLIERAAKKAKKEKEKGSSLVERAAKSAGDSPFERAAAGGIGVPSKRKPDPSSLNPSLIEDDAKPSFKGIGSPDSKPKAKPPTPANEDAAPTLAEVEESKPRSLAIGDTAGEGAAVNKKAKKRRAPEEIDLVALREAGYITPDMPPNLMSEEFRIIKRSLLLNAFPKGDKNDDKNNNVILVTSSNPSEGKTFCTINLALSIATEQDVTVLLVDADFSKPEILNRLGIKGGRGLMDVVADGNMDVGDCLVRTNIPNLVLLPAGRQHNLTTELLASERMESMVNEISTRYKDRIVIFDSPPVLASSAASVLALYMGQTVFVIEAEKTTEPQIKESLGMISACESINLLLNKTRYNGSNKKFASYYGYGGR
ncbi:MAG: tyrosine-protein kinase family protein [Kordiimonadaceae bacterium]|nr:tyrosine-protein kinase family protein [Kordiimonadaceae bacterium]MBO6570426.1 tyrosine-protein kinase family protein [Kordiimonadaceae bacterium]MBO6965476.1 tyrosine-protein kinase family protein [Kordiimonadaceae bacterium]